MKRALSIGVAIFLLGGCSAFTPPMQKPVIEDRISEHEKKTVGVLATTAERRVVLVKMPEHLICSEPPPDAADNISAAITAIAKGEGGGKISSAELGFAQSLATSVKQLFVRSQGIQLYRDGTFVLCTAFLNKAIKPEQFFEAHQRILDAAVALIRDEIPRISARGVDNPPLPNAPAANAGASTDDKGAGGSKGK